MIQKAAALGLAAVLITSCAPIPKQAPSPPAPAAAEEPAPVAANAPDPPMAATDVRAMTCAMLTSAQDDDKAYASTFLLGYRSALMRTHTFDVKRIEAVEEAALADCASKPEAKASQVFHAALLRIGPEGEARTIPHHRHRQSPAETTAGQGAPEQTTPEPAAPVQSPAMQYAPAQTAPAQPAAPEPAPTEPPSGEPPSGEGSRQ